MGKPDIVENSPCVDTHTDKGHRGSTEKTGDVDTSILRQRWSLEVRQV